jgi:phospholipid transport system substrate-binding protein
LKKHLAAMSLALVVTLAAPFAYAGPATDVVKAKQTALFDLLKSSSPETDKKVAAIFDQMFDYEAVAKGSLGSEWAARSDAEKAAFSDLHKQIVRKQYLKTLKGELAYNIEYTAEAARDGGSIAVNTRAVSKSNAKAEPIVVAFVMTRAGATWKITDLVMEDVSMVSSQRSQYTKIIKKDGFATLIQKMKDSLTKDL